MIHTVIEITVGSLCFMLRVISTAETGDKQNPVPDLDPDMADFSTRSRSEYRLSVFYELDFFGIPQEMSPRKRLYEAIDYNNYLRLYRAGSGFQNLETISHPYLNGS